MHKWTKNAKQKKKEPKKKTSYLGTKQLDEK